MNIDSAIYKLCDCEQVTLSLISSVSLFVKWGHYFLPPWVAGESKWVNESENSMTHIKLYLAVSIFPLDLFYTIPCPALCPGR